MYSGCPVCQSSETTDLVSIDNMPVYCNVLHRTQDASITAAVGAIDLVLCKKCTHIYNRAFDPSKMDYSVEYENSLHYSKVFTEYSENLAQYLTSRFKLNEKSIVEIGCGKGDFLQSLCEKGNNSGYGFDRSFDFDRNGQESATNITFYQEFYSDQYSDIPVDFLCCRHVLEHIQFPLEFLKEIAIISPHLLSSDIYFEVPNGLFTLRDFGIWDIIYEHCSYFTPLSLRAVFRKNNFEVRSLTEAFGGQFLSLEARLESPNSFDEDAGLQLDELKRQQYLQYSYSFVEQYKRLCDDWFAQLKAMVDNGEKTVIWGAGSKGVTFLNIFKSLQAVEYAVDLNPHKHTMFVPGSGQQVIAPEFLTNYQPDNVIIMNGIYQNEISEQLASLGVKAKIFTV